MEAVDQLQRLRIVKLDAAESDQTLGMGRHERFDAIEILGSSQQESHPAGRIQLGDQFLQERRIAVVVHVGVDQPRLGDGQA